MIPPAYFFQGFRPWLSGLWGFLTLAEKGHPAFFLGEYSSQGWWNYFLVAFLIKTSVGSLTFMAASLAFYRAGTPIGHRAVLFLLVPVVIVLVTISQAKVNVGVRHILAVYPFLFVLASRVATVRFRRHWCVPLLIGTPLVWTAISSLQIAPHQLAYFNELVGGPAQGYRYLSDSNIDWGQDLKGTERRTWKRKSSPSSISHTSERPRLLTTAFTTNMYRAPARWNGLRQPTRSRLTRARKMLAISVYNLQDVSRAYDPLFRWLWSRQPVAKIGYAIFVYDLTNDQEGLRKLEETYAKAGISLAP